MVNITIYGTLSLKYTPLTLVAKAICMAGLHQCVFVEVQQLVSSYGEYTHSSVCVRRSAAYRDRVHMVFTPSSVSQAELVLLLADYEVPIVHKSSI